MAVTKTEKKRKSNRSLTTMPHKFPDITERVNWIQQQLGLTWAQMALDLDIHVKTMISLKNGIIMPNIYILKQFKKVYQIPFDFLIDGSVKIKIKPRNDVSTRIRDLERALAEEKMKVKYRNNS